MNVVFVSHCDFHGNSAMHIFSIANELQAMGEESVVCVPDEPGTVRSHGTPRFQVLRHDEALRQPITFPDGRGPDLVHAWTPRELVRKLTEAVSRRIPRAVSRTSEDNEEVIVEDELGGASFAELGRLPLPLIDQMVAAHRSHPIYYPRFLANAAGVTALMDRLLEFKPAQVPGMVFWAGFDAAFAAGRTEPAFRPRLGLGSSDLVAAYTGNVHDSNVGEARSLVAAVAALHTSWPSHRPGQDRLEHDRDPLLRRGQETGLHHRPRVLPERRHRQAGRHLGRPRAARDAPEISTTFAFPLSSPSFSPRASRSCCRGRTSAGSSTTMSTAYSSKRVARSEIAAKLEPLLQDPDRRTRIGAAGREFALRELMAQQRRADPGVYDQVLGLGAEKGSGCGRDAAPGGVKQPVVCGSRSRARLARETRRLLLAAVPPDPGERRLVGRGIHGVDERAARKPLFPGHQQPRFPPTWLLRPAPPRGPDPGGAGQSPRAPRVLLLLLLVRRQAAARAALSTMLASKQARLPVLRLLGQRELDAALGRPDDEILIGQDYSPED